MLIKTEFVPLSHVLSHILKITCRSGKENGHYSERGVRVRDLMAQNDSVIPGFCPIKDALRGNRKSMSHRDRTTVSIETHRCSVCPVEFSLSVLTKDYTKQPVTQTHSQEL